MRLVVTLAVGEQRWGQMALSLCLSVKANSEEQKTLLIYSPSAINGIEHYIEQYFDYTVCINQDCDNVSEFAFHLKTKLYDIVTEAVPEADTFLFLDADTIMLAGKSTDRWFEEHEGKFFTAYCNDRYDFATKTRKRKDYHFWCNPEDVAKEFNITSGFIPQINTSFLYFVRNENVKNYFDKVKQIWDNDTIRFTEYRNSKPDELCFNIASAITQYTPHRNTYRPIFFQFVSETHSIPYIHHNFNAMGFAGDGVPHDYLVNLYNNTADYYRTLFGIQDLFKFQPQPYRPNIYLAIKPLCRRTLYRRGELPNSEGGVFNPDAIHHNGELVTVFRKEAGIEKSMYVGTSAAPHYESKGQSNELSLVNVEANKRLEDFRLFHHNEQLMCNHTICDKVNTSDIDSKCGISFISNEYLSFHSTPNLPIPLQKVEKNWVFFSEGITLYCIYSLNPYKLFYSHDMRTWKPVEVEQAPFKWIDKSYISNSTNPILIGDHYLIWFHSKESGAYHHGAALINRHTKLIEYATPKAIEIQSGSEGLAKKITYVSGCVHFPDTDIIRVLVGEGDAHAIYNDFNATKLIREIKKYKC